MLRILLFLAVSITPAYALDIVAAENFYGDVAQQVGGADVNVTSILSSPDQDPHLFEASPSVAKSVATAAVVVYSGVDYDPWMEKLVNAARVKGRRTIVVSGLSGHHTGDNPHVWYDINTMRAYATTLSDVLAAEDPPHAAAYRARLGQFQASLQPLQQDISRLRARLTGVPVTATEPVFGYMFEALGLRIRNLPFQLAVMNDTEPSAGATAAFEKDLRNHVVRLLVYNSQASNQAATRMQGIARAMSASRSSPATETEPAGVSYQEWMAHAIEAVDKALPASTPAAR